MFAALPPSNITPWTLESLLICSLSALILFIVQIAPSKALIPFSGALAACAVLPKNSNWIGYKAIEDPLFLYSFDGWATRAISILSKAPCSAKVTFAPLVSSAGVPNTTTVPPISSIICFNVIPAPVLIVPNKLWPQPWPIPGNASYSDKYATVKPSFAAL